MSTRRLVAAVMVALAAAVVIGVLAVDGFVRSAMEDSLTRAFGTEATVESVDVGLLSGDVTAEGIEVANPEGFDAPRFAALPRMRAETGFTDLLGDTVTVRRVEMEGLELHLERRGTSANFVPVLASVKELRAARRPGAKRYRIDELVVRSTVAHARLGAGGGVDTVEVAEIRLEDLGAGEGGAALGQVAGAVLQAVLRSALARSGGLPGAVSGLLRGELGELGDLPGGLDLELGPADDGEEAAERIRDAVDGALPR